MNSHNFSIDAGSAKPTFSFLLLFLSIESSNLCWFMYPIITHEPLHRFASNFEGGNSAEPREYY